MGREPLLFTPGPLTTSLTVKQAMLRDLGSRDREFIELVARVRRRLLEVAGVSQEDGYEAVPMQGSGTFGVESAIGSIVPRGDRLLVLANGAYGERMAVVAERLGIECTTRRSPENVPIDAGAVSALLRDDRIAMVAVVHCETTSGIVNPVEAVGEAVRRAGRLLLVDAMSSFGAIPLDLRAAGVDFLVASSNKCLEGVPGLAFAVARRAPLAASEGRARSLSLDLYGQWKALEGNGQFRFTPPTHVLMALDAALAELQVEGGVEGRAARYRENHACLVAGMRELGFTEYLEPEDQGYVITSFHYPRDPRFRFEEFYARLRDEGMVIYPGKVGDADCFRIGTIGRIDARDVRALLAAIERTLAAMQVQLKG
jgi:2-aminoethylphosphonate-pyruvate transaminase